MSKDYQDNRKRLAGMLKSEPPKTPIQEVRPVDATPTETFKPANTSIEPKKDAHVNFWVPDELMEQIKVHAARSRKSIKQIGIEAFEEYLAKRK